VTASSRLYSGKHLGYVQHGQRNTVTLGNALQMHQTRNVGRHHDVSVAGCIVTNSIAPHLRGNGRLANGERSTKATTLVATSQLRERESVNRAQERTDLIEWLDV